MWWLELDSNQRPSSLNTTTQPPCPCSQQTLHYYRTWVYLWDVYGFNHPPMNLLLLRNRNCGKRGRKSMQTPKIQTPKLFLSSNAPANEINFTIFGFFCTEEVTSHVISEIYFITDSSGKMFMQYVFDTFRG